MSTDNLRKELQTCMLEGKRREAVQLSVEAVSSGKMSMEELFLSVLTPIMKDLGSGWQQGSVPVWREHLATAITRSVIDSVYAAQLESFPPQEKHAVVLACLSEEQHELGILMLSCLFEKYGWRSYFLGADSPEDEVMASISKLGARYAVFSADTHFHKVKVADLLVKGHPELTGVRIWVTGAAFMEDSGEWHGASILSPHELLKTLKELDA